MTEAEYRIAIVAEAKSWERTPYLPYARVKGVGVDCAQFPIAVYHSCGLIPDMQPEYSQQWMNHRDEELYLAEIRKFAREISPDEVQAGDLMIWKFGRVFSHSGIVIAPNTIVHAAIRGQFVYQTDYTMEEDLKRRLCKAFTVFGV